MLILDLNQQLLYCPDPADIEQVKLTNEQAVEKRPSAALPLSFVVATYTQVRLTPQDFGRLASGHF
jgi:hypothetical protein